MRKQVSYETCHVALHRYCAGGEGYDLHEHPELQAGIVLQGHMAMEFPDGPKRFGPGDLYVIPGGILHGGTGDGPSEALVLNLYLRPHLMAAERPEIFVNDLEGLRGGELATVNAVLRRIDLEAGQTLSSSQSRTADEFDILLSGTARFGLAADAQPLSQFDVVRRSEAGNKMIQAGPTEGATLLRISIPAHSS